MEGCPRSLMLKLNLKESQVISFAPALKRYVREFYHEDAEAYSQECSQLEQLRTAVIQPTYDNSGCNLIRRYYGQIHLLKTRFPMGEGSPASVEFTWTDLYTEDPITLSDISYEQSSILFNLGALHSLLGSKEDRVSEEGMKVACTHYQSAAGAFTYIKENFSTDQYSDTSKDLLSLYINVMLGQAQECLLEKSMLDHRKNSLVARIAMQVENYYTEAIACLTSSFGEILPPKMHKQWSKTLQIKCAYLNALAYMYMANTSDEQGKYGEKVAFLKIAGQKISEAQKLLKNQSQQVQDVVQFITDVITQKLDSAKRDNDFIYHEAEPAVTALPEIKGASLVKPIPFQPYDSSMGKDIFEKLIPIKAHESSSLYSEEKANLLRRYVSIVSEKDKELSTWLASMHIDDLLRPEEADNLPVDLTNKCESLQSNPGAIKKSTEMLTKLKEKGTEMEKSLEETLKEITDVQNEKKTFMDKYGVKLEEDKLKEFLDDVKSFEQKHVDAKKTNDELEKAFEAHRYNLELMVGPEQALHGILPSQNILDSPIEDDAVQRIRDLLAKIEKMKTQRAQFLDILREQVNKDDITHLIATRDGADLESLFKEELKKHDECCELLQCNLDAQEKIMKALTEANAKYAHARRSVAEIKAKRDVVVKSLIGSYNFFMSFKEKVSGGVTFYNQMLEIFDKRRQEITAVCKSEKERLQKIIEKAKQIKEERERKPESKFNPTVPGILPPERQNNPGNPQQPLIPPAGYPQPNHILLHPVGPAHQAIPHSLRGPAPNQPLPNQPPQNQPPSRHPGQFPPNVPLHPPHGPNNPPGVPQQIPRIPSGTLLTARPRMSYPHPPFTSPAPDRPRPPTSVPWEAPPRSRPSDGFPATTSNMRFPQQHVRPPNVPQGPSMHSIPPNQQQYSGRPVSPTHTPQGLVRPPHSQGYYVAVGSERGNWQSGAQQYGKGPPFALNHPAENRPPPPPQMVQQRPVVPQQPMHLARAAGQPPLQQRPAAQLFPYVQQNQPVRPESPQRAQGPYQFKPPSYEEQFAIRYNQLAPLQKTGPQGMQPGLGAFPPAHQQTLHSQRPEQYQQPQPVSHQVPSYQPPVRFPSPSQLKPSQQQQVPSGHHQLPLRQQLPNQPSPSHQPQPPLPPQQPAPSQQPAPPQQPPPQQPPPQQAGAIPQQPSGPYHQFGANQQRLPFQPSHQQGYRDQRGPTGPPPQHQSPNVSAVQKHPPTFHQPSQALVPSNLPPALEPQSYQNQPVTQKLSSEHLPPQQQQVPYQPSQPHTINPQDPLAHGKPLQPVQESRPYQHERAAKLQTPYSKPLQPTQERSADQMLPKPAQDQHGQLPQPYNQGRSESHYPSQAQAASSHQQDVSNTVEQTKSRYFNQQWQEQQFRPPSSQQSQTNKVDSKVGGYPPTSTPSSHGFTSPSPLPTSTSSLTQVPLTNKSRQQDVLPPKPGLHPSPAASSQDIPTETHVASAYSLPTSSHSFIQRQQESRSDHSPSTHNANAGQPLQDSRSPYFPAPSTQLSERYLKENQSKDNLAKNIGVSSSFPNFCSKSFQDFSPTKVVLTKPGALSVSNVPSAGSNQNVVESSSYGEISRGEGTGTSLTDLASPASGSSKINSAQSSIIKPTSTIDDKLLENLKSLDIPQSPPPKQPEKLSEESADTRKNLVESGSNSSTPGLVSSVSSQEDVHKLQQKVLLQQQQLIEQQQRFLEQQTLGEHSQVWRLMEQIKQQQKELEELRSEMKIKDQFGEIEKHLENLERRQNVTEARKPEQGVKSDEQEVLGKTNKETGTGDVRDEKKIGDSLFENPAQEYSSDASTLKVAGNIEEIKEDFLMSQLSQFTSTSSKNVVSSSSEGTLSATEVLSDDPPPKPSRMPPPKPGITMTEKATTGTSSPSKTAMEILNEESKMPHVEAPADNETPPPKPVKYRPPPPRPEPQVQDEVSNVSRDVFTKSDSDADEQQENGDQNHYVLRLAHEIEYYKGVVNNLSRRQARGPSILTKEWLAVQHYQDSVSQVLTSEIGKKNATKNRYLDILPYDRARVILQGKEDSDYINATMIEDLTPLSPKYIASQGPIPQCFLDFWLMVWEQKCPLIVMLTNEVEGKKLKCHQYWPKDEGHSMLFGSLRVTMKRQTCLPFWKERIIHITHNETQDILILEHYQFTGWPDHGVPSNPADFFTFMGHVYIRHQTVDPDVKNPIILHCSAGVGRTGAFIVIYSAMREMYCGNGIMDVQKLVKKLREKRKYMVQKKEQYEFCYRAILHCAEQFLIIENASNTADDSSDDLSSSDDTCGSSSSDYEDVALVKPSIPQRPHNSQNQRETDKKENSDHLDSKPTSQQPSQSKDSGSTCCSQKCEEISENSDNISLSGQNSEKVQNLEESTEAGNTLNNFLEICTSSFEDGALTVTRNEENKTCDLGPGRFQSINVKISSTGSPSKEPSPSKGSDMGETKYKEIMEEPEELTVDSGNTNCENVESGPTGGQNTAVIPGLQEIQQGLIQNHDDEDVIQEEVKTDVELKSNIPVKQGGGSGETLVEDVDVRDTDPACSHGTEDGLVECEGASASGSDNVMSQQEMEGTTMLDLPQKDTDVTSENDKVKLSSRDAEISEATENE